jgi:hypothetical protein
VSGSSVGPLQNTLASYAVFAARTVTLPEGIVMSRAERGSCVLAGIFAAALALHSPALHAQAVPVDRPDRPSAAASLDHVPVEIAEPYRLQISGDWRAAADA